MSNKAREPMTKPEEVIAWAEETRAGNGEAFTMLKKEEQLLIAKFILAMRDHIKKLQSDGRDAKTEPPPTDEGEAPKEEVGVKESAPASQKQSNIDYFKANEIPMNRAYQLYCTWRKCDPENRTIYDDERKAWVKAAAFAYWLNLPHE